MVVMVAPRAIWLIPPLGLEVQGHKVEESVDPPLKSAGLVWTLPCPHILDKGKVPKNAKQVLQTSTIPCMHSRIFLSSSHHLWSLP